MKRYLKSFLNRETAGQFVRMGIIGVVNTVIYFALFNIWRLLDISIFWSVTLAFAIATLVSYVLNRHWVFKIKHGWASVRESVQFFAINAVAWAITASIVVGADRLWGPLNRLEENLANVAATVVILLPKFASYRDIVFGRALAHKKATEATRDRSPDGAPLA